MDKPWDGVDRRKTKRAQPKPLKDVPTVGDRIVWEEPTGLEGLRLVKKDQIPGLDVVEPLISKDTK